MTTGCCTAGAGVGAAAALPLAAVPELGEPTPDADAAADGLLVVVRPGSACATTAATAPVATIAPKPAQTVSRRSRDSPWARW